MREVNGVVALRKESVDRNCQLLSQSILPRMVALRKESVDRNVFFCVVSLNYKEGRSPQGERG